MEKKRRQDKGNRDEEIKNVGIQDLAHKNVTSRIYLVDITQWRSLIHLFPHCIHSLSISNSQFHFSMKIHSKVKYKTKIKSE